MDIRRNSADDFAGDVARRPVGRFMRHGWMGVRHKMGRGGGGVVGLEELGAAGGGFGGRMTGERSGSAAGEFSGGFARVAAAG